MTELAVPEQGTRPVSSVDLVEWADAAGQAYQIATRLAETSFVPKVMQRRPDEITGCILAGRELGLSPMVALRSIDVIDGTPAMRALALRGLAEHHGHQLWVEESNDHRAIVCGQRAGSTHIERSTWTMDRAKKAGLAGKKNWQAHPAAMLIARATAEVCRLVAADVLLGMPYAIEELSDDGAAVHVDATPNGAKPATTKRRTVQRPAPVDPAEVEPPLVVAEADAATHSPAKVGYVVEQPAPATDVRYSAPDVASADLVIDEADVDIEHDIVLITAAQSRRMHAGFTAAGIKDRAARLEYASAVVGRPLSTSNELTKVEAGVVIDALDNAAGHDDAERWGAAEAAADDRPAVVDAEVGEYL